MRAVITFHDIGDGPSPLSFPPRLFSALLDNLSLARIPVLPLEQLLAANEGDGVALTFDDGIASVFHSALPILRAHASPASVFLTTGAVGGDNRWPSQPASAPIFSMLNWRQLDALREAGVEIEAHTDSHPDLRRLPSQQIEHEFARSDEVIATKYGRRPRFLAYPYGLHDERVRGVASRRYDGCLTTELRFLGRAPERAAIPRLDSHYLRNGLVMRYLAAGQVGAYLGLRRLIRQLRRRA